MKVKINLFDMAVGCLCGWGVAMKFNNQFNGPWQTDGTIADLGFAVFSGIVGVVAADKTMEEVAKCRTGYLMMFDEIRKRKEGE